MKCQGPARCGNDAVIVDHNIDGTLTNPVDIYYCRECWGSEPDTYVVDGRVFWEPYVEKPEFEPKYRIMNPDEEDVINSRDLRDGMIVLVETPTLREDVSKPAKNAYEYNRRLEWNQWCEVTNLSFKYGIDAFSASFIGVYPGGTKMARTCSDDVYWLVKKPNTENQLGYLEDTVNQCSESEPAFSFGHQEDGKVNLNTAVFEALGAASMCWSNIDQAGVFQSERAEEIGVALTNVVYDKIAEEVKPNLGLATTRELLKEVAARIEADYYMLGGGLDYSTIAGRPEQASVVRMSEKAKNVEQLFKEALDSLKRYSEEWSL